MSWARVDDGTWEHDKFKALRAAREHTAGFLWVLALSYCGRKGNPTITIPEAQMLLLCSEAEAKQACEVLRSTGLLDGDSASKHIASYLVHDWEQYRSKDEAKVEAGRKGGMKSGESRKKKFEAEPKQPPSTGEAEPKQTSTPDPDPDPVPDPVTRPRYPSPIPVPPSKQTGGTRPVALNSAPATTASAWTEGQPIRNVDDLLHAVANVWHWSVDIRTEERARAFRLYPIEPHELHEQKPKADKKPDAKWRLAFMLGCIERSRSAATEELAKGPAPAAAPRDHRVGSHPGSPPEAFSEGDVKV